MIASRFKYKYVQFIVLNIFFITCSAQGLLAQLQVGEAESFVWRVEPFYKYRSDGKPGRVVRIMLKDSSYQGPITVKLNCNSVTEVTTFNKNDKLNQLLLPEGAGVDAATEASLIITAGKKEFSGTVLVPPKKQWTVYIYPHSHLDIGYTGLPEDVKKIQVRNIDVGIDMAEKTQSNPDGSRFVWNPEATWVVNHYLEQATPDQVKKFIDAVRKGWVRLDGGHSNSNTSTCSDEELVHFFKNTSAITKKTGVPITTMVQVDVPGVAWGLVTTAAQFGITGFISFPNNFDLRKYWEHKPFYWLGPDGKTKMLFLQGFPYGIGYTIKGSKYGLNKLQNFTHEYDRVSTSAPLTNFLNPFIFEETEKLEKLRSPYDLFAMTWSMADNCVIDADLPDAVNNWNKVYAYPRLIIAGAKEILTAYEEKFGSIIPTYSGDFTEFWTNGLGSDAHSVGVGREAKEDLVQCEILSSMLPGKYRSGEKINKAWENQLLSAEHTWGAQDPRSELARQVEKIKSGYFINSKKESAELISGVVASFTDTTQPSFSVINTQGWQRDGIITLTASQSRFGNAVVDESNKPVSSQRLSTGELIFRATNIPALGSRLYKVVSKKQDQEEGLYATHTSLRNDLISLEINDQTGNITSLKSLKNGYEYVDSTSGLNSYQYVTGVYNGKDKPSEPSTTSDVSIRIKEKGPLLVSLLVTSRGEGVSGLTREISLYQHSSTVELTNTYNKLRTRQKEAIHFGFAFNLPGAVGHIDMPWSIVTPNINQLDGSNKNWFSFQRWVDISNQNRGITWTAIQSPLIEWGKLSGNILDGARQFSLWQKHVPPSSSIYSWVLNNHWDTNFPLEQGGDMQQRYSFMIHDGFDKVAANRFGMEQHRPLIVVQARENIIRKSLVKINNPLLVISTIKMTADRSGFLLRVRSLSEKNELLTLDWPAVKPRNLFQSNTNEESVSEVKDRINIEPYGMMNLKIVF